MWEIKAYAFDACLGLTNINLAHVRWFDDGAFYFCTNLANVTIPGLVRVGMDDFARKMIGRIDAVEFPAKGSEVKKGGTLFTIRQAERKAAFASPVAGKIHSVNAELAQNLSWFEKQPYEKGWVCSLKPDQLAADLESLRIGDKAAAWYQEEIRRICELLAPGEGGDRPGTVPEAGQLVEGQLEDMDDSMWKKFADSFLTPK